MSSQMLTPGEAEARLRSWPSVRLIGIDGLPLAGKSTLASRLAAVLSADCVYLDDFVRPQSEWPDDIAPGYPFPFIRYDDFIGAVTSLARTGACAYRRYDWSTGQAERRLRRLTGERPVIVEGVSALATALAPLYDVRIWVESDPQSTMAASLARGVGDWEREWRELFLPSVAAYLRTEPKRRADLVVAGRGAPSAGQPTLEP
jgi:uridine kinase